MKKRRSGQNITQMQSTVMMEELIGKRVAHFLKMGQGRRPWLSFLMVGYITTQGSTGLKDQIIVVDEKLGAMTVEKLGKIGRLLKLCQTVTKAGPTVVWLEWFEFPLRSETLLFLVILIQMPPLGKSFSLGKFRRG